MTDKTITSAYLQDCLEIMRQLKKSLDNAEQKEDDKYIFAKMRLIESHLLSATLALQYLTDDFEQREKQELK